MKYKVFLVLDAFISYTPSNLNFHVFQHMLHINADPTPRTGHVHAWSKQNRKCVMYYNIIGKKETTSAVNVLQIQTRPKNECEGVWFRVK